MKMRIYYDDTDAGGVVYHANYLKFCERARSEVFFTHGKSPAIDGGHFVVRRLEADFIKSAKLGDLIEVKTTLLELKNASLHVKHEILKEGEKLFEMVCTLAFVREGKVAKIDEATKKFFMSVFAT